MLPWKEIVRGLLEVQRLRSCILPSVVEACLQTPQHASIIHPRSQQPVQRMFSTSRDYEGAAARNSWSAARPRPKPGSKHPIRHYVPEDHGTQPQQGRTKRPPHISFLPTGWSPEHRRVVQQLAVTANEPEAFSGDELDQSTSQSDNLQSADYASAAGASSTSARRSRHPYGPNLTGWVWYPKSPPVGYREQQQQGRYVPYQQEQQPEQRDEWVLPVHTYFVGKFQLSLALSNRNSLLPLAPTLQRLTCTLDSSAEVPVHSLFHLAVLCDSLGCGAYGTFCYGIS